MVTNTSPPPKLPQWIYQYINNGSSQDNSYQVAEQLMHLYFIDGSPYYEGPVNVPYKTYIHKKKPITIELLVSHLKGEISIAAPPTYNGLVKWIAIDFDSDVLIAGRAYDTLRCNGFPCYISFSGKGYHLVIFLSSLTPLTIIQKVSASIMRLLKQEGLIYDKISPSPNGSGNGFKLPLGVNPENGNYCYFLDESFNPVYNPLSFLHGIQKIELNSNQHVQKQAESERRIDVETGEVITSFPRIISQRRCINKLWNEGLQAPNTRHSATCVIANALVRTSMILPNSKEQAIIQWVHRMYPKGENKGYISSDLLYDIQEAIRLLRHYQRCRPFAELCENQVFKAAMRSACDNEYECKLEQNRYHVNFKLLLKLGLFNAQNAKVRGIGKAAMAIYFAIEDIALDYPLFNWNGIPAFSLSIVQLVLLSNCSRPTVIKARNKLIQLRLLLKVHKNVVPGDIRDKVPKQFQSNIYALPELTEDRVRSMLKILRGKTL